MTQDPGQPALYGTRDGGVPPGSSPYGGPPAPPAQLPRRVSQRATALIALGAAAFGWILGSQGDESSDVAPAARASSPTVTTTETVTEQAEDGSGPASTAGQQGTGTPFQAGTYLVGTEIAPGLYTGVATEEDACYWERLSGLSGDSEETLAIEREVGQFYLEVLPVDVALTTSCTITLADG